MADFEGFPIIWVSSSLESESSEEYATCTEDSIDLELLEDDEIAQLIRALDISEEEAQAGNGGGEYQIAVLDPYCVLMGASKPIQ